MAVALECYNVFVHLERLAKVYPGGKRALFSPDFHWGYHDGQILRLGAMSDYALFDIECKLKSLGLRAGKDYGGFSLPWLEMTNLYNIEAVELKGKPTGTLIHYGNFQAFIYGEIHPKEHVLSIMIEDSGRYLVLKAKSESNYALPSVPLNPKEPAIATISRYLKKTLAMDITRIERHREADTENRMQYRSAFRVIPTFHEVLRKPRGMDFDWISSEAKDNITKFVEEIDITTERPPFC